MAWIRMDRRRIVGDLALPKQGETYIARCNANLNSGAAYLTCSP
jgi:hypothetical protein